MSQHYGRVLVIDDDPGMRDICVTTLARVGFTVEASADPEAAIERVRVFQPSLILLDILLPRRNGLSLMAELRQSGLRVPVLLISGQATIEQAAEAMRLGARGLLLKPFQPDQLRSLALEIVSERRATRSRDRFAALRPVSQVSQRLLSELDLERLHELIIETVRSELEADRASLMLLEDDGRALRIAAISGLPDHVRVGQLIPAGSNLASWVAHNRQPLRVDSSGRFLPTIEGLTIDLVGDPIVSALSVPLLAGDRVLGVLNAAKMHHGPPFGDADQELLSLLAGQAAIAIENARLYSRVAQSEERYRALLQHASDAVLLMDARGSAILDTNLALEQLSGYPREDLLRLEPAQLLPAAGDLVRAALNGRAVLSSEGHEIETELRTCWDSLTPVAVSLSAVPHAGEQLLLVIARDISERQRIAKQLVQAEKLAALGRLSASMAHEINNPLQAIHNSVHLLLSRPLPEEKRERYLTMARDEIERLISIVQRILDFYRPSRDGMRPVDMGEILDAVLLLSEAQIQEQGIVVMSERQTPLPRVYAISNHIKQVCLNLLLNALEAMPDGGELRLRCFASEDAQLPVGFQTVTSGSEAAGPSGRTVVVEISDSGAGIPAQDLPKIFEPFFTTRTKGVGLGLAVSYSIVEQHHGTIAVRSGEGGTTFRVILPAAV